jgi:hypothetical protein
MEDIINEECNELKNIKYKTMLLNGIPLKETKINNNNNISCLEKFLENEQQNNINGPWCKLDKTVKIKKLLSYVDLCKDKYNLNCDEETILIAFFRDCLERKKLQKVKDVIYDKNTGTIKDIPALLYNKKNKHFTLKIMDKRISTLKSLPPKKIHGTIKNKQNINIQEEIFQNSQEEND